MIQNATFYSVPENWLNCSLGPYGPLGQNHNQKFPPLFHETPDPRKETNRAHHGGEHGGGKPPPVTNLLRDLRQALNRRCSGITSGRTCHFNLRLDHEPASTWGTGLVDLFYRCVPHRVIHNSCPVGSSNWGVYPQQQQQQQQQDESQAVVINTSPLPHASQFLASPAYPKYYKGGRQCRWSLRSEPGQRIQVRVVDVSLKEASSSSDTECSDVIRVTDRGKTLLRMCGESKSDIQILSHSNKLEVRLVFTLHCHHQYTYVVCSVRVSVIFICKRLRVVGAHCTS